MSKNEDKSEGNTIEERIKNLKNLVSDIQSDHSNIRLLKDVINKIEYKELLSKLVLQENPGAQSHLAEVFRDIADLHIKLGSISGDPKYYTDAAVFVQYSLNTGKNNAIIQASCYEQLKNINESLIKICGGDISKANIINKETIYNISHKDDLQRLREETSKSLKEIDQLRQNDEAYITKSKTLFQYIAKGMEQYLATIYKDAEAVLGTPPCKYTVVGLGSMALQQMTPWSDLEFAIIIEDNLNTKKNTTEVKNYFRNLSYYAHFKVICLGETAIPYNTYELNLDHLVPQAVNFDLGGKTPLNREDKFYDLIQTVGDMFNYAKNEENKSEHIDKNLPYILEKACFVHGDKQLFDDYQSKVNKFLFSISKEKPGFTNSAYRAFKVLALEATEIDYKNLMSSENVKKIQGNLIQFGFKFDAKEEGKQFNVKQEIYRMPDRFIYNLAKLYNIQAANAWDSLERLAGKGIISQKGKLNLQKALSFATTLRAKIYDHYKCQREDLPVFPDDSNSGKLNNSFKLNPEELETDAPLFQFYYSMIPLAEKLMKLYFMKYCGNHSEWEMQEFSKSPNIPMFTPNSPFLGENFYRDDNTTKAYVCLRLKQRDKALGFFENASKDAASAVSDPKKLINLQAHIGYMYYLLNEHQKAYLTFFNMLEATKEEFGEKSTQFAQILHNAGVNYIKAFEEYLGALNDYIFPALETRIKLLGFGSKDVSHCLATITCICALKNNEEVTQDINMFEILDKELPSGIKELLPFWNQIESLDQVQAAHEDTQTSDSENSSEDRDHTSFDFYYGKNLHPTQYYDHALNNMKSGNFEIAYELIRCAEIRIPEKDTLNSKDISVLKFSVINLKNMILLQLGNLILLNNNVKESAFYFEQMTIVDPIRWTSKDLIKLEVSYSEEAYEEGLMLSAINCQRVLTKIDPEFKHGNHYHNLACYYATIEGIPNADKAFKKALVHSPNNGSLHAEYAQFLILNKDNVAIKVSREKITEHLYAAISGDNDGALEYRQVDKSTTCKALRDIIGEEGHTIVDPKALAYYLLITYPEYQSENYRENLVRSFVEYISSDTFSGEVLFTNNTLLNVVLNNAVSIGNDNVNVELLATINDVTHYMKKQLLKSITNFKEIPVKDEHDIRVVSYNIVTDYFDKKDNSHDKHHHWVNRSPFVKQLLTKIMPDIICLQELSAEQAKELNIYLNSSSLHYRSVFLSQTPSDLQAGEIAYGDEVEKWCGKFAGTPLIGTFISDKWNFQEVGRFWLKEKPDELPEYKDRGTTDKGFGNMNTYRAVLWTKLQETANSEHILFVFNSHYPLSGDNKARLECAKLEMTKVKEIVGEKHWVSAGDRNLIPSQADNEEYNPQLVYEELVRFGYDIRDSSNHFGVSTTWLGFLYDNFKNAIAHGDFTELSVLDIMVSNIKAKLSFCHPGGFDHQTNELLDISAELLNEQNEGRYFASDHALIGADFSFSF